MELVHRSSDDKGSILLFNATVCDWSCFPTPTSNLETLVIRNLLAIYTSGLKLS